MSVPGSGQANPTTLLHIARLRKSYGASVALDISDMSVAAGKVTCLLGANGCGKSTLVKAVTGVHRPDIGYDSVSLRGRPMIWPASFAVNGIAVVQQDQALFRDGTIIENFVASRRRSGRLLGPIKWSSELRSCRASLEAIGYDADPRKKISSLDAAECAIVAIARALEDLKAQQNEAPLLILDEPTANLGRSEVDRVLDVCRSIAAVGGAVLLVNHRLGEVRAVADDIVVLRNGRLAATGSAAQFSDDQIYAAMFGSTVEVSVGQPPLETQIGGESARAATTGKVPAARASGVPVLDVDWLPSEGQERIRISAFTGEIVGVSGLLGMGQDQLPYMIMGVPGREKAKVRCNGVPLSRKPWQVYEQGVRLVPADRQRDAFWVSGTLEENWAASQAQRYSKFGVVRRSVMRSDLERTILRRRIVSPGLQSAVSSLSGGNQQRLSVARAVNDEPWSVLLLHEPTQGIDLAARNAIRDEVRVLANAGKAVVVFGSDYAWLAEACNRVVVLRGHQGTTEVREPELSEESIANAAMTIARYTGGHRY